jgi:glycosyltransferase involved in cell wall biosynthesis
MFPVLLGYPNIFAGSTLRWISRSLNRHLDIADILLVREPWQFSAVYDRTEKPIVYSSHNVEVDRFDSTMSLPFSKWVLDKTRELEKQAVQNSEAVVCTSERDADRYRELFDSDKPMRVLPNGTYEADIREHRPNSERAEKLRQKYGIDSSTTVTLFVGSNYAPNVEAGKKIFEMANRLKNVHSDIHFLIVGTVGKSISSSLSNMTITGFVDDFEAHMDLADIALNPILSGGGTNIKVLDYFARSLPVITTPFGIRGIQAKDGHSVVTVKIDQFTDAINSLANNTVRQKRIGKKARQLVDNKYTWEESSRNLHDYLEKLL